MGHKIELRAEKTLKLIANSSRANSRIWNKEKKIDDIIFPRELNSIVNKVMPEYKHQYQSDLFRKYAGDFIKSLPSAYDNFDNDFYEVDTHLYKFFQWKSD